MAPDKKWLDAGGICILPKRIRGMKFRVEEARKGGLLGADRAGTW